MKRTTGVIVGVLVLLVLWGVGTYNRLVSANQAVDGAWAQVETQYQRRFDVIPNLTESVKGMFEQEQEVFGQLADARSRYAGAASSDEKAAAAGQVESALSRLLVVVERYPELRSSETVKGLMDELAGTENRVSVERKRYNDQVRSFNTMIARFPSNVFARMFGFESRKYFTSTEGADVAPKIDVTK